MNNDRTAPGSFLGTGWSFPPEFPGGGAEVVMVSGVQDIHQSLQILFATRRNERPMQESYGCNLHEAMFELIDHSLNSRISALITDAVLRHEPRVALEELDVSQDRDDAAVLRISLIYRVLTTNSRYNMVFPFYLNEAHIGF